MTDNFLGYVVKVGNNTFPTNALAVDGYSSTPDMQTDQDSYTDGDGVLHRNILPHRRSKLYLKTNELTVAEKQAIQAVFTSRTVMTITYWNDETEAYDSGDFYIPDIKWSIKNIDKVTHARTYSPIEITLVEY